MVIMTTETAEMKKELVKKMYIGLKKLFRVTEIVSEKIFQLTGRK